jgi:hypothetical protein
MRSSKGKRAAKPSADMVEFLAYSGWRVGEARKLRWQDVNFKHARITIVGDEQTGTKNRKAKTVPMSPPLIRLLQRLRDQSTPPPKVHDFVFGVDNPRKAIATACKALGYPDATGAPPPFASSTRISPVRVLHMKSTPCGKTRSSGLSSISQPFFLAIVFAPSSPSFSASLTRSSGEAASHSIWRAVPAVCAGRARFDATACCTLVGAFAKPAAPVIKQQHMKMNLHINRTLQNRAGSRPCHTVWRFVALADSRITQTTVVYYREPERLAPAARRRLGHYEKITTALHLL